MWNATMPTWEKSTIISVVHLLTVQFTDSTEVYIVSLDEVFWGLQLAWNNYCIKMKDRTGKVQYFLWYSFHKYKFIFWWLHSIMLTIEHDQWTSNMFRRTMSNTTKNSLIYFICVSLSLCPTSHNMILSKVWPMNK